MIKVMTVNHAAEAHLVRGLLQAEGINAEIRSEVLSHVWVIDDPKIAQAMEILARYSREETPLGSRGGDWVCPGCGEEHGPAFQGCWQCGTMRPETV
jgi:hypothetical protein